MDPESDQECICHNSYSTRTTVDCAEARNTHFRAAAHRYCFSEWKVYSLQLVVVPLYIALHRL